jgi:hypothetical protein
VGQFLSVARNVFDWRPFAQQKLVACREVSEASEEQAVGLFFRANERKSEQRER